MADAASLPLAEIEHRLPGRMRLRLRGKRGDAAFFQLLADRLASMEGVRAVRTNPGTASLLVEHEGGDAALLDAARERKLFEAAPRGKPLAESAPLSASRAPAPLDLAAIGLAGAGLVQAARGQIVGSASENLWNAYGLYAATGRRGMSLLLVGFGLFQIARGEVLGSATSLFLYALSARRMAGHQKVEDMI
jgi:hypothetical protein